MTPPSPARLPPLSIRASANATTELQWEIVAAVQQLEGILSAPGQISGDRALECLQFAEENSSGNDGGLVWVNEVATDTATLIREALAGRVEREEAKAWDALHRRTEDLLNDAIGVAEMATATERHNALEALKEQVEANSRAARDLALGRFPDLSALAKRIAELEAALGEATDAWEAEIRAHYPPHLLDYPHNEKKLALDLEDVEAVRRVLKGAGKAPT